ncbi:MAG TPA: tetratricopeptide repeat protein [Rhizomicrobium sp.]
MCPDGWDYERSLSHNFKFYPLSDLSERLELKQGEPNLSAYRDRTTGQEVYVGWPNLATAEDRAVRTEATDRVLPFIGDRRAQTQDEIETVVQANLTLERLTAIAPDDWRLWFFRGVARRALGDRQEAYAAFARAYGLAPGEIEAGRNLVAECMTLGYSEEAKVVAKVVCALAPDDAGLRANYALALLTNGDLSEALNEVQQAQTADPQDEISRNVRVLIEEVISGASERPTKLVY